MAVSVSERQQLMPLAALLVLAIVSVLTLVGLWWWQPAIETDLLQRTRQAVVEAGLSADGVHFSGRDGILIGTISSDSDAARLQAVVSSVYGVRSVENRLIPAATARLPTSASDTLPMGEAATRHIPRKTHPLEQLDLSAIQFEYARVELKERATQALAPVITHLKQQPNTVIEVAAHTDNQGTALGNYAVTQERAEVIRNYLLAQGVSANQVVAKGYGATRPLVENNTPEQHQQNRRIEITVLKE